MTKSAHLALAGALLLSLGSGALAAGGLDGDNNPAPGGYAASMPDVYAAQLPDVYAAPRPHRFHPAVRNEARIPHAQATLQGDPNAVYWRGRYVGTDPDPQVRRELLRDAISGGG